jgi:DnaJ-class molecular chaperone
VTAEAAEPDAPEPCAACRGSGVVISNLGGEPHQLSCPWCDGGGVTLREHDAQARWRAAADADAHADAR